MVLKIKPRYSHITLLLLLVSTFSRAQDEKAISQHLGRLRAIFDSAQVLLPQPGGEVSTDPDLIKFITEMEAPAANPVQEQQNNLYLAKRELLRKQIGLNYTLDGIQNISPSQQDVEDNILYQRRYQNGIEWNVLKDGYVDSRNEMKVLELEQELERLIAGRNHAASNSVVKNSQLTYWFDLEKRKVLEERAKLLDKQLDIVTQLYYQKKITKDVLLDLQSRISEVKALEDVYSLYPDYIQPVYDSIAYSWEAPLFDLNYETLLYTARRDKENVDTAFASILRRIEQQNKWFNEIQLKAYVRHSYYDLLTVNPGSRAFFSTGVGLSVPLTFTHKEQNAIEREEALIKIGQAREGEEDRRLVMLTEAYDYRIRLKNYIVLNQRRIMVLEEIRKERVKEKSGDPDFNPLHGLELVDELLHIDLQLMDLKLELYVRLVKIHELMENYPVEALIVPLELPNSMQLDESRVPDHEDGEKPASEVKLAPLIRAIQLPKTAFAKHSADFITAYILHNEFSEVQVVVPANNKWSAKELACLQYLSQKGIKTDLLFTNARLLELEPANIRSELYGTIGSLPTGVVHGIHIGGQNSLKPSKSLEKLLAAAHVVCDSLGTRLSVDLAQSTDTAYVGQLMKIVDKVWFPLSNPGAKSTTISSLQNFRSSKDKVGVTLYSDPIGNRTEMEAMVRELSKETGVRATSFIDLERLVELDNKSVDPVVEKTDDYEMKVTIPEYTSERNIYVWSKIFLNYSVDQLSHYIQDNSFTGVQMAVARRDELLDQKINFLKRLNDYHIQADLMYGRNSILDLPATAMHAELVQTISNYPLKYVHGLHLDVEPHTRDDWETNQELLKSSYKTLVKEARLICDSLGFKLTIDLPLTLDTAYVREMLSQTDMVRFMCYENTRKNYITRKLRPFLDHKEKLVIALRTEDFKSRDDMESLARKLKKETGIKAVNFHDLGRLMNLDLNGKATAEEPDPKDESSKEETKEEETPVVINKNVYVWSRTFGYYTSRYLAAYIDTNEFKEVQLAIVRGDVYLDDKRAFMIALNQQGVKIDLMFAQKQILNVGSQLMRWEMTQTLAKYPMKYVTGIHLDIEPHTRRDWRRNPEGLKLAYSMLLEEARFICDSLGLQLSVDIPVSYDAGFVKAAMRKADVVRLLCYNTSRKRAIVRRLKPYLADSKKLAIALSTDDFRSTKAMNELAIELCKETGITTINFHDLRNLIELDH